MDMGEWGLAPEPEKVLEEYSAPKSRSMWDVMNAAINKKIKPTLAEKQKVSEFMFHKLLARFENTLDFALMFTTKDIPIEHQWDIINNLVDKGFVPFEKGTKKVDESTFANIIKYYRCSPSVAEQYLEIMPDTELARINDKYNKGKK